MVIEVAQGSEQTNKGAIQPGRTTQARAEVARPEQVAARDDGRSHGLVFVRPLRPSDAKLRSAGPSALNPECKTHRSHPK